MVAVQELKELLAKNASGVLVDQPNLERTCDVFIRFVDYVHRHEMRHLRFSQLCSQLQARRRQRLRPASQSLFSKGGYGSVSGRGQFGPGPVRRAALEAHQRGQERCASVDQRM